jgi:threonine aldolase
VVLLVRTSAPTSGGYSQVRTGKQLFRRTIVVAGRARGYDACMARFIDLRSDTTTKPSAGMLRAMASARLGDEQRRDDPTVNLLQARMAELLGQPAALLFPTATMANQIAIAVQCRPADEILCHPTAHVYNFEGGGLARNAQVQVRTLVGDRGQFSAQQIDDSLLPDDPHFARTRLVVVENTSNVGGGSVWPVATIDAVAERCQRHGLALHLDGARLFNAAISLGVPPSAWSARASSAQVCFSKGLGCPFGAILAGSSELIEAARRMKQSLGGALRQAGVIAGAMLYALDHNVDRLALDHEHAQRLAAGLSDFEGIDVEPVETNLVYFNLTQTERVAEFIAALEGRGVGVHHFAAGRMRACTHLDVDRAEVDRALVAIGETLNQLA